MWLTVQAQLALSAALAVGRLSLLLWSWFVVSVTAAGCFMES